MLHAYYVTNTDIDVIAPIIKFKPEVPVTIIISLAFHHTTANNKHVCSRFRDSAFYDLCLLSTVVINCYGDLLCWHSIHLYCYSVITNSDVTEALLRHRCDLIEFTQ